MFFDNYVDLCKNRGVSPSSLAVMLGFSKGTYSQWKRGSTPSNAAAKTIADYFGITVSELTGEETNAAHTQPSMDGEMAEILTEFKDNPELRTLFSLGKKATPEELKKYIDVIKAIRGSNNHDGDC